MEGIQTIWACNTTKKNCIWASTELCLVEETWNWVGEQYVCDMPQAKGWGQGVVAHQEVLTKCIVSQEFQLVRGRNRERSWWHMQATFLLINFLYGLRLRKWTSEASRGFPSARAGTTVWITWWKFCHCSDEVIIAMLHCNAWAVPCTSMWSAHSMSFLSRSW